MVLSGRAYGRLATLRTTFTIVLALGMLAGVAAFPSDSANAATTPPTFTIHQGPQGLADSAGEPSIGWSNFNGGAALFQAYSKTLRVTFNDAVTPPTASWTSVTPITALAPNLDPILWTDHVTGRTFAGGLDGACSVLSFTDNNGASWTPMSNTCSGTVDHQTIGSGAWKSPAPAGATYSRAVYYCAQAIQIACATSLNGGLTFTNPSPIIGPCDGLHGHIKVGPDGTAYAPVRDCNGRTGLILTTNNGLTWVSRAVPSTVANSATPSHGFDPSLAISPGNRLYLAWEGSNFRPMVAVSTNSGTSYTNVVDLGATMSPAIEVSTFHSVVVGDDDRAAVAFLGSTTGGNPHLSSWNGVWDLYVSYTFNGGVSWTTQKLTSDPVQRGWICADGIGCNQGRNLLDFMDATIDHKGRVLIGFADGCISTCAGASGTKSQSVSDRGTIARQSGGKTLFAAFD